MLFVLGAILAFLVVVSLARAAFLKDSRPLVKDWGPLTVAGCALGAAFVLYLPSVDLVLDPAAHKALGVANLSDAVHILLTLITWWALGVAAVRVLRRDPLVRNWFRRRKSASKVVKRLRGDRSPEIAGEWAWTLACLCFATAAVIAWTLAQLREVEVDDMLELDDVGTTVLAGMYTSWALIGGALVVTASAMGLRTSQARAGVLALLGAGLCGAGYAVTVAVVVVFAGMETLRDHARLVMAVWAMPGLAALALGGAYGLVRYARRRCGTGPS